MDFFIAVQSGAVRFIYCDVKTAISSNSLPLKEGEEVRYCGAEEYPWQSGPHCLLGKFLCLQLSHSAVSASP